VIGETADKEVDDDAASVVDWGDASPLGSGLVIFSGPRERSAILGVEA
jgi:hypothetical protein